MTMQIRTPYNLEKHRQPVNDRSSKKPSMTVPDQSMTVKEILDRHARGLPLDGRKVPMYEGETDMPDLKGLDLAERQALYELAQQELEEIKQKLNKKQHERIRLTLTPEEVTEWRKQQAAKADEKNESTNIP